MVAQTVEAAGAVTWRRADGHTEVLLIHRPKYDDWSFPKGKLDRGERAVHASVREVEEETGVRVRLGMPLVTHEYEMRTNGTKRVHYWTARPIGADDVSAYAPNHEVDGVRWVRLRDASALLTYERDRDVLDAFRTLKRRKLHKTRTLVVLRHADARSRSRWKGPDTERTLTKAGDRQAVRLAATLQAYGLSDIVSSDAARCIATVTPYADAVAADIVLDPRLAEEGARPKRVRKATYDLLDNRSPVVAATHRPVLPYVADALGLEIDPPLATGEMLVVHHRNGEIAATERHPA
ncbi:NUDIX domain-containing protein [Nocardioidaceae bacterium SCSIO 66511]|nr:NUDIX domain-containing protein [Nocardioidaceae bacterium SCSIO 66511]